MLIEVVKPEGEQQGVDPVQATRSEFNKILLGKEYNSGALFGGIIQLQNALLASQLTPERIYHELAIVSGQASDRAELNKDTETALTLRNLQKGYELTYENFRPRSQSETQVRPTEPTQTQNLPPMTSAKGGETQQPAQAQEQTESPQQPKKRGRKPKPAAQ